MSDGTGIQWTDATWNPIRANRSQSTDPEYSDHRGMEALGVDGWACVRVSPGCNNCYAERINQRLGTRLKYDVKSIGLVEHFVSVDVLERPLRWKRPRKVFVQSMTDLFGEWITDEQIDRVFAVMALTPQHTYQVLTKRSARMRRYLAAGDVCDRIFTAMQDLAGMVYASAEAEAWPLPNVWLGVSAEDDTYLIERWYELAATPAAKRFISYEPALGPLSTLEHWVYPGADNRPMWTSRIAPRADGYAYIPGIDWIIVGGESGPGARPFDIGWARDVVEACRLAEVPVFVKQLGARPLDRHTTCADTHEPRECWPDGTITVGHDVRLKDRKGGDMAEWPSDLRVREFPE